MFEHLSGLIDYICTIYQDKFETLEVVTNSTLMPDLTLLKSLQHQKVYVILSDYGKLSVRINDLQRLFDESMVRYERAYLLDWTKHLGIQERKLSDADLKEQYNNCCYGNASACVFLANGRLYKCNHAAYAERLQAIPFVENNSIDLKPVSGGILPLSEEIMHLIYDMDYIEACKYCSGVGSFFERTIIAEQADKPQPYCKTTNKKKNY